MKKKMTPEELKQMMKDIGHGKAQEIIEIAVNNGTREQVENALSSIEEMAIYILAWRTFNKAIHEERFRQSALVEIQSLNDRIQDEVEELLKEKENGGLVYKEEFEQ